MTAPVRIQAVQGPEEVAAFIRFPYQLHAAEPHWVPPLIMEREDFLNPAKNPVYEYAKIQLFLARRGDKVVGTIAAVHNERYCEYHPEDAQVGFFGLYDCIPDQDVAGALFEAAGAWLRERGKSVLRGPVNLTTNDVVGLLVEGFDDDPTLMMPYNPPYYADQMEAAGFTKAKDLLAFSLSHAEYRGQLDGVSEKLLASGRVKIRPIDLSRWNEELEFVRSCYNVAWAKNWGFVPWTDAELAFIAKELKPLIDPRLTFVGMIDGVPAGFLLAVPDANQALKLARGKLFPLGLLRIFWKLKVQKCTRLRTIAMGVLPRYRRRGLDAVLVHHLIRNSAPMGYPESELGWILEDNVPMLGHLDQIGARRTKTYRVYDRQL
jgi:GNAT superfamily N-acetyltransferase